MFSFDFFSPSQILKILELPVGPIQTLEITTKDSSLTPVGGVYGNKRILSVSMYRETQTDQKQELPVVNSPGGDALKGYSCGWWYSSLDYLQSQPIPQTPGPELFDQGAFGSTP